MVTLPKESLLTRRLKRSFPALSYPNYRIWFVGQLVSLLGSWMQGTAQGFLMFELTHSTVYLGYIAFAAGLPSWIFMLYGGVIADRISRRKLMIFAQSAMMLLSVALALLTFLELVQPWHLILLAFLLGIANSFDAPARQAFVLEMVEREDLTNAIALNSTMFNMATALGPALAGLIYAAFGPSLCFGLNALSFIAVIVALAMIRPRPRVAPPRGRSVGSEVMEGLRFVARHPDIRILVLMVIVVSVFGLSFVTLMPAWAVRILGGDATTNGFLQSARGAGALAGALFLASLGRLSNRGRLLQAAALLFPLALLVFSAMREEALSFALLFLVGAALIVIFNLCNSLVQTLTPDPLRGRVMGIYSLAFFGFMPVGGLYAGTLAEWVGEPGFILLSAALLLIFWVVTRLLLSRLYKLS